MGDVNGDGSITTADARLALRIAVALEKGTADQCLVADVSGDDLVQTKDARRILQVAIHIYDEDYFYDKFYTDPPPPLTGTTVEPSRDINWDDIFGTSTTATRVPTTTEKATHPNNQFTKPTVTEEEEPGTVPDSTAPDPTQGGEEPGTVPDSTTAASTIIHTGTPSRPSTEPAESTLPVSTTEDPNAPRLTLKEIPAADGQIQVEVWMEHVAGVKSGILEIQYSPSALRFVSFDANASLGMIDFREGASVTQLLGQFALTSAASDGSLRLGTLTFAPVEGAGSVTSLTLTVKDGSSYNWTGTNGPMDRQPKAASLTLTVIA